MAFFHLNPTNAKRNTLKIQSISIKTVKRKFKLWNKSLIWKSPITLLLSNSDKPLISPNSRCLISYNYDPRFLFHSTPFYNFYFLFWSFLLIKNPITALIEAYRWCGLEKSASDRRKMNFYLLLWLYVPITHYIYYVIR